MVWLAFYVPITFEPVCLSILKKYVCIDSDKAHARYGDSDLCAYVYKDMQKMSKVDICILIRRRSTPWIKKNIISKLIRWADRLNHNAVIKYNAELDSGPQWNISALTKHMLNPNHGGTYRTSYTWVAPYDIRRIETYTGAVFTQYPSDWIDYLFWLEYVADYPIRFFKAILKSVATHFNGRRIHNYKDFIRRRNVHHIVLKTYLKGISDEDSD